MTEYIGREEAMFRLSKWLEKASDTNNRGLYNFGEIAAYQTSIVEINSIPAADVKPVVRGEWVHFDGGFSDHYYCTACHKDIVLTGNWRFCPNCGADMRKEADDA